MGRLDDIAERNQRENRKSKIRVRIAAGIIALVVFTVLLAVFTDLAQPKGPDRSQARGIQLRRSPAVQAAPTAKANSSPGPGSQVVGSGSANAADHAAP